MKRSLILLTCVMCAMAGAAHGANLVTINGRTMGPDEVQRMFDVIRRTYGVDKGQLVQADGRTYFTIEGTIQDTEKGVVLIETEKGVLAVEIPEGVAFKRKQEVGFVARRYGSYSYEVKRKEKRIVPLLQPVPLTWQVFLHYAKNNQFAIPEGVLDEPGPNDEPTRHAISSSRGRHWNVEEDDED